MAHSGVLTSPPFVGLSALRIRRPRLVAGALGFACAVSLSRWVESFHDVKGRKLRKRAANGRWRINLSPFAIDAIAGAMGEIVQICVLYPLDTIKVQCQAEGCSTLLILKKLQQNSCHFATLRSLYAGCGAAAVCSAVIGAAYLVSFCGTKRLADRMADSKNRGPLATDASLPLGHVCSGWLRPHQGSESSRGPSLDGKEDAGRQPEKGSGTGPGGAAAASATAAALVSCFVTSILESPIELFRHRLQAGALQGSLLQGMKEAWRGGGWTSLYWGYTGFVIKAIPYDVGELFTYSMLSDTLLGQGFLPSPVSHLSIGALSGVAAVVCSMPADCIKTRLELSKVPPPRGVLRNTYHFFNTGRVMVLEGGMSSMFVGMLPRLAEKVPSTMLYWVAVEACRQFLEQHCTTSASVQVQ